MWLVARVVPRSLLSSPEFAKSLAGLVGPLITLVDKAVGEAVAMKASMGCAAVAAAPGAAQHAGKQQSRGGTGNAAEVEQFGHPTRPSKPEPLAFCACPNPKT